MIHISVGDARAWHEHVSALLETGKLPAARLPAPQREPYRALVTYVWDPFRGPAAFHPGCPALIAARLVPPLACLTGRQYPPRSDRRRALPPSVAWRPPATCVSRTWQRSRHCGLQTAAALSP